MTNSKASANLSPGYRINRGNYVGLRSGYILRDIPTVDADPGTYYFHGIPAVAEYTHYFAIGKAKLTSIIVGAEGGWSTTPLLSTRPFPMSA